MKTRSTVAFILAAAVLLFLVIYAYRGATRFAANQTCRTSFTYVGPQKTAQDELAIFRFANGEGVRLRLTGNVFGWNEHNQTWNDTPLSVTNVVVPNRRSLELAIDPPTEGKWRLRIEARAEPTPFERIRDRFARTRSKGGVVGGWGSPEMSGATPVSKP